MVLKYKISALCICLLFIGCEIMHNDAFIFLDQPLVSMKQTSILPKRDHTDDLSKLYATFLMAKLLMEDGKLTEARELIVKTIKQYPKEVDLYIELADIELRLRRIKNTIRILNSLYKKYPNRVDIAEKLAMITLGQGDLDTSKAIFEDIVSKGPSSERTVLILGNIYLRENNIKKGINIANSFLKINPNNIQILQLLSRCYIQENNPSKASEALERALKLNPTRQDIILDLGLLEEAMGNISKALGYFSKLLPGHEDDFALQDKIGELLTNSKKFLKALNHYKLMEKIFPDRLEIKLRIAYVYLDQRKFEKVIEILNSYITQVPNDDNAHYLLGNAYAQSDHFDNAIKELDKIHNNSEIYVEALTLKAYLYSDSGNFNEAKTILEEAISLKSEAPIIWAFLGNVYDNLKKYEKAIRALEKAHNLDPSNDKYIFTLATFYDKNSQFEKAAEIIKEFLKQYPDSADALNFIGYMYAEHGINLEKAIQYINKALEIQPHAGYIIDSLGWIYFKQGKTQKALDQLLKAKDLEPTDPVILEHLGDVQSSLDKNTEAIEYYIEALKNNPENPEKIEKKIKELKKQPRQ